MEGEKGNYLTWLCYLVVFSNKTLLLHYLLRRDLIISKNSFPGRQKFIIRNLHQKLMSTTIELFSSSPLPTPNILIFLIHFLIGGKVLYNVVLVSALQKQVVFSCAVLQHKSVIIIHIHLEHPSCFPSHYSRSSQSTTLGSLCYIASSHQLSTLHVVVHICCSVPPTLSFHHCVHKSALYICISIPSLQIDLSISFSFF